MSMSMRRITMRDVAEAAGVSVATVSAAVNDRADQRIPDETRRRVRATARELGYHPNPQARAVRTGRSEVVLLSLHMLADPWSLAVAEAVDDEARAHGLSTLIAPTGDWAQLAERIAPDVVLVDSPSVDDIVRLERLAAGGTRVVAFTGEPGLRASGVDVIESDPSPGASLVVDHLADRTDDVTCLTSAAQLAAFEQGRGVRIAPYRAAVADGRIRASRIVAFGESETDAFESARELLAESPPRALYCTTDFAGLAAIRAAQSLGMRVPDDLLVAGLGATLASARSAPGLTTAGPDDAYARIARIVAHAATTPASPTPHTLEWHLVTRASTDGAS